MEHLEERGREGGGEGEGGRERERGERERERERGERDVRSALAVVDMYM